jgi:hypothetical protein
MATVGVQIVILTVWITLSVCPFNCMAHTANIDGGSLVISLKFELDLSGNVQWESRTFTTSAEQT